jgi:hypothetical protein
MAFTFGFNPENLPVRIAGLDFRDSHAELSSMVEHYVAKKAFDAVKSYEANARVKKQGFEAASKRKHSALDEDTEMRRLDTASSRGKKNDDKLRCIGHSLLDPAHNVLCCFVNARTSRCKNLAVGPVNANDMFDDDDYTHVFHFCKVHRTSDLEHEDTRVIQNVLLNKALRLAEADVVGAPVPAPPAAPAPVPAVAPVDSQDATSDNSAVDSAAGSASEDDAPDLSVAPAPTPVKRRGRPAKVKTEPEQVSDARSFSSAELDELIDEMHIAQ